MRHRLSLSALIASSLGVLLLSASLSLADPPAEGGPDRRKIFEKIVRKMIPGDQQADANQAADKKEESTKPVKADTLDDCLKLYSKGKYGPAIKGYRKLLDNDKLRVRAAIGLADALSMKGKYSDAVDALKKVSKQGTGDADWHVAMAEMLRRTGGYKNALKHADAALKARPAWAPAIWVRGRLLETVGRRDDAVQAYKSMERVIEADDYHSDARSLVALGRILDRYGILTGRKASEQAQNILHNYLQEAYLRVDKDYWPAHIAAGELLLDKHRPKTAVKEFQLALKKNKNLSRAYVGIGTAALEKWQFENVLKAADKALKINPNDPDAHLLRAVCYMQWRKFEKVPPILKKIFKVNPNHLDALSLAAAAHIRMYDEKTAKTYVDKVHKINKTYVGLPTAIGDWLSSGRQFDQAKTYYDQAIELDPKRADAWANLGLLYMQTGEEKKARSALEKAHELDDFRSDVVNYLKILDRLDNFLVKETEHFVVKVAPQDEILLEQVAEFMETIHEEVCADFDYTPKKKTIIEIMPTQQQFGLRIAGKGWVPTVGAATGTVIVLAAPKPDSAFGTHNWATVLRHEYTHTVTLEATNNRIPHWFTEACAVWEQPDRRNYKAVKLLVAAVRHDRLFPIQELDWGFIRPKRRTDRSQAYAQSEWTMEYIIEKKGYNAILQMLDGFRDGMSQKEVFRTVLNTSEKEFNKAFGEWAHEQIREWGFEPDPAPDLAAAKAAARKKKNADNVEIQATYAVSLYMHKQLPRAKKQAEKVLKLDADNAKALAVLASVSLAKKDYDKAIEYAGKLEKASPASVTAARVLARAYLAKRNWPRAITALERLQTRQPLDSYSYQQLAKFYKQFGKPKEALRNLVELHRRTMKDAKYARQIAEIYRSLEEDQLALEYFHQIAHINPYEYSAYQAIAEIHYWAGRYDDAIDAIEKMLLLQPKNANAWTYMAKVQFDAGREAEPEVHLPEARSAAQRALELNSQSTPAAKLLQAIEAELEKLDNAQQARARAA
jgi:tetratricopeptide (TPR) repeat protein